MIRDYLGIIFTLVGFVVVFTLGIGFLFLFTTGLDYDGPNENKWVLVTLTEKNERSKIGEVITSEHVNNSTNLGLHFGEYFFGSPVIDDYSADDPDWEFKRGTFVKYTRVSITPICENTETGELEVWYETDYQTCTKSWIQRTFEVVEP